MDNTTFLATWGDAHNIGMINLTIAELKEFTRSTGSNKGALITLMLKFFFFHWYRAYCQKSVEKYQ